MSRPQRILPIRCFLFFVLFSQLLHPSRALGEQPEVRIGVLSDFSGKMAFWGHQTRIGAELAAEDLKMAGIPVRLIFEDTVLDTTKTTSATQKLLSADKVDAVYGEFTPITASASPILKNSKTLFLYSSGSVAAVKDNPSAMKTFIDFVVGCRMLGHYWKGLGIKKVGLLKISVEPGELCRLGLSEVYPDLLETSYNPSEAVNTQVIGFKQKGVEAIANVGYEPDLLNTMKAVQDYGFRGLVGANEGAVSSQVIQKYPVLLAQTIAFGLPSVSEEFIKRVLEKDPQNSKASLDAAAVSYLHIRQIGEAIPRCKEHEVVCQIEAVSKSPANPLLRFKGWRERIAQFDFVLRTWKDGKMMELPSS